MDCHVELKNIQWKYIYYKRKYIAIWEKYVRYTLTICGLLPLYLALAFYTVDRKRT